MSPYQHGEVYVLDDGNETDLDLGHYERFTNGPLSRSTTPPGRSIFRSSIRNAGRVSPVRPYRSFRITNEIKGRSASWTVGCRRGDHRNRRHGRRHRKPAVLEAIPNSPWMSARIAFISIGPCAVFERGRQLKTKPTQHSVGLLPRRSGIQPDILICRHPATGPTFTCEDRVVLQRASQAVMKNRTKILYLRSAAKPRGARP